MQCSQLPVYVICIAARNITAQSVMLTHVVQYLMLVKFQLFYRTYQATKIIVILEVFIFRQKKRALMQYQRNILCSILNMSIKAKIFHSLCKCFFFFLLSNITDTISNYVNKLQTLVERIKGNHIPIRNCVYLKFQVW